MKTRIMMALSAAVLAACGSGGGSGTGGGSAATGGGSAATGGGTAATGGGTAATGGGSAAGFPQPAGTVAVNFTIDDSANKVFKAGELEWKGSHKVDETTRKIILDSAWDSPFPKLFDDGPWNVSGHEPAGSTAGDNKWGVTVFATPPATGEDTYQYGAIDVLTGGWIWRGPDGTYKVAAGATAPINAAGLVLPAFGTIDVKIVMDSNALDTASTWNKSKIEVKGNAWTWALVELKDDGTKGDDVAGDGKFTFLLSTYAGLGKQFPHAGLANTADNAEFVFQLGDVEYKDTGGTALSTGITAFVKPGATFVQVPITFAENKNTRISVP